MPQYSGQAVNTELGAIVTLTNASASGNSNIQTNALGRGVQVRVNVSAISGTGAELQVTLQGYDPASQEYYTLLQSAEISATGLTVLTVIPGAAATANVSASAPVPPKWRIAYAVAGTTPSITATISACSLA